MNYQPMQTLSDVFLSKWQEAVLSGPQLSADEPEPIKPEDLRPIRNYTPYGGARELWNCTETPVIIEGPADTGKTLAMLGRMDALAWQYPGFQGAIVRKTYKSMPGSVLQTFEKSVLGEGTSVKTYGGSKPEWYDYPNSSRIWVGGMDNPTKVLSSERDAIAINQTEELTLEEWEYIKMRCTGRAGNMPYGQLMGDANPDAPTHWIKQEAQNGKIKLIQSRHEDNPTIFDQRTGKVLEAGKPRLAILDSLSGVRYSRYRLGLWVAAEGMVYQDVYDAKYNLIDHFDPPMDMERIWGIDFGYRNPFCWKAYAKDYDGRLYMYREVYFSERRVDQHCTTILKISLNDRRPSVIICDHDAEDRATFEAFCFYCKTCELAIRGEDAVMHRAHYIVEFNLTTQAAFKAISPGIQAVSNRWKLAGDSRPRLYYMKDSLVERDEALAKTHKPFCSEGEIEGYVWVKGQDGKAIKEVPEDKDNHGMDVDRYVVCYVDNIREEISRAYSGAVGALRPQVQGFKVI
jgi:hypothetical protein